LVGRQPAEPTGASAQSASVRGRRGDDGDNRLVEPFFGKIRETDRRVLFVREGANDECDLSDLLTSCLALRECHHDPATTS
jgi:hypothetical protein